MKKKKFCICCALVLTPGVLFVVLHRLWVGGRGLLFGLGFFFPPKKTDRPTNPGLAPVVPQRYFLFVSHFL